MNKNDLIYEIVVDNYPNRIQLSAKRRTVYWTKNDKNQLPKKYNNERYEFGSNGVLYDIVSQEKVIKNSISAGKPKFWSVNFQAIWNQQVKYQGRALITSILKNIFRPYIEKLDPITTYPIRTEMFIFDTDLTVDVDNKGVIYNKVITDLLVNTNKDERNNKKIIPDDSAQYINDTGRCKFIKIKEGETPKMVIRIWKSNNEM